MFIFDIVYCIYIWWYDWIMILIGCYTCCNAAPFEKDVAFPIDLPAEMKMWTLPWLMALVLLRKSLEWFWYIKHKWIIIKLNHHQYVYIYKYIYRERESKRGLFTSIPRAQDGHKTWDCQSARKLGSRVSFLENRWVKEGPATLGL